MVLKLVDSLKFGGFPSLQSLKAKAAADLNELGIIEKLLGSSPPWFKKFTQKMIDDCKFEPGVFNPDGAVAESNRVKAESEGEDQVEGL